MPRYDHSMAQYAIRKVAEDLLRERQEQEEMLSYLYRLVLIDKDGIHFWLLSKGWVDNIGDSTLFSRDDIRNMPVTPVGSTWVKVVLDSD